ncbi:MAG: YceI family protein [Myxococcaceae bacterium]
MTLARTLFFSLVTLSVASRAETPVTNPPAELTAVVAPASTEAAPVPAPVMEAPAPAPVGERVNVTAGLVRFTATSNVKALSIHGESTTVVGGVELAQVPGAIVLKQLRASVAVESLVTGMAVRDRHMQERVFKTAQGQLPSITFESDGAQCPVSGNRAICSLNGKMSIRGAVRPVSMKLNVFLDEDGKARAQVDASVKLSDFGIEAPAQFGVKVNDAVDLHVELSGKANRALTQR